MSTYTTQRFVADQRGFTLVELMVTVAIALFLLGGLVTIVENVRKANFNQTRLAQLQDEQRFALTVITDAVQSAGYFADPTTQSNSVLTLPIAPNPPPTDPYKAAAVISGSHVTGVADTAAQDTIAVRFQTAPGYGPILCDGTDTAKQAAGTYSIQFSVVQDPVAGWQLLCSVNNAVPVPIVTGVQAMAVYYGVKRQFPPDDYNVDTYVTWDNMSTIAPANDYLNVSSVRVVLTFTNPLSAQAGQPAFLTVERVIEVMSRAGMHT
jgi:type IV pilus assembly protein PilW